MQRNLEEVLVWEDKIVVSRSRQEIELVQLYLRLPQLSPIYLSEEIVCKNAATSGAQSPHSIQLMRRPSNGIYFWRTHKEKYYWYNTVRLQQYSCDGLVKPL